MVPPGVYIAVPSLGEVRHETMASLMQLTHHLQGRGHAMLLQQFQSADIAFSRNTLASNFYWARDFSHLLFVDSDMSFAPAAVQRMLDFDRPLTAQVCPKRRLDLARLRALIEAEAGLPPQARTPMERLLSICCEYAVRSGNWDGTPAGREVDRGFLKVPACGAAVMLIRRDVLTAMVDRGVAAPEGAREAGEDGHRREMFGFFTPVPDDAGRPLSEDLSFCRRWVEGCGGEIWADTETPIAHHGHWAFTGRYADVPAAPGG